METSGIKSGPVMSRDGEDTDEEEDRNDSVGGTTVADLCSASHEFEWFSPHYSNDHGDDQRTTSCQARPMSSRPPKTPTHVWPCVMHPSVECRRHLSPMRSSWCCPSPPPVCMDLMTCYVPNWHHEVLQRPCRRSRHSGPDQWQIPVCDDINSLQKVQELEGDKKNLILQANVLADQVDAQAHKIEELERQLDRKKDELFHLEQNIHQEVLARSTVENSKLELMTELSNLRLRLTAAERDRKESDDKCRKLEHEFVTLQTCIIDHETELSTLKGKLSRNGTHVLPSDENFEIKQLKSALDSVIVCNDEKDQKIEGLRSSMTKYEKMQDIVLSNHSKKAGDNLSGEYSVYNVDAVLGSSNNDAFKVIVPQSQYGTMPRHAGSQVLQQLQVRLREHEAEPGLISKSSTLQKRELPRKDDSLKHCTKNSKGSGGSGTKISGVSFAAQECVTIPSTENEKDYSPPIAQPYLIKPEKDKNRGFMKFFSKWKKTGSQNIDHIEEDFKRGGIRATAGPRLAWSKDFLQEPELPFIQWNTDLVIEWLHKLGLSMYVNDCKRWMCTGDMLLKASTLELEKELCIKNPLHRKKLSLAIKSMTSGLPDLPLSINNLDYNWVVRWLDDVGLPQYKDSFSEARVDGRVLHCLTIDDLLYLKVTSQLHHISIRRGIQVLREKGFDPHCLIRRSLPDESKTYTPELVTLWSNHRVMEWLRTVDLSEYAPNLRGSGVHGALIVYDPQFNTNLFATLLNIPPTKTLLRRHLATHFKHIVGDELTQLKREKETETSLSPSVKVKVARKSQFALKKKRNKAEYENEDYVCPMEIPVVIEAVKSSEGEKLVVRRNSDPSPHDPRHVELQAFLQNENLNEAPTTIV